MVAQDHNSIPQSPFRFLNPLVYLGLAQVQIIINRFDPAPVERRRCLSSSGKFQVLGCSGACSHLGSPMFVSCDLVYFLHDVQSVSYTLSKCKWNPEEDKETRRQGERTFFPTLLVSLSRCLRFD